MELANGCFPVRAMIAQGSFHPAITFGLNILESWLNVYFGKLSIISQFLCNSGYGSKLPCSKRTSNLTSCAQSQAILPR
jgi:hypothetical protein